MKTLAIKKFEATFNRYLSLDPESPQLLTPLMGRTMALHIKRPKIAIYFSFAEDSVHLSTERPEKVNTEIFTTLFQLMRLKLNPSPTPVNTQFHITGDVDTAQLFNQVFQKHHIDWEEHLSKIVGDIAAYKMASLFRKSSTSMKANSEKFCADVTEYCQEEAVILPSQNEVEHFRRDTDELRLQVDRLQARINVLKNKL